jgi:tripartite motif-containing protein 71
MKKPMRIYLFILAVPALLLASCGSPTAQATLPPAATPPPTGSIITTGSNPLLLPASTPNTGVPDVQLSLLRTIDGGTNTFGHPNGLAIDSQGNLYVLESVTNRIQVFDPDGKFLRMWGKAGSGQGEFDFANSDIELGAIAISADDIVYVADPLNQRVQKFTADGIYLGQWGSKGKDDGQFLFPTDIAVDLEGHVIVTDEDSGVIQIFDSGGKFLSKIVQRDFGGAILGPLAIGPDGRMYVADNYVPRIMIFKNGKFAGDIRVEKQTFYIKFDRRGNLYAVSDGQMVKYDSSGKPVYQFTGLKIPTAVAVDANGLLFITDIQTNTVKVYQEL